MLGFTYPIFFLIVAANSANLPEYFRKCSLTDPKLNTCLTKSAVDAWPSIVKGDNSIHVQPLDPLEVISLNFQINDKFKGNGENLTISGFADLKINEINLDLSKKMLDIYFLVPHFVLRGEYDISGELLSVPIKGHGLCNGTFFNMDNHLHIEYKLTEKNGKHYIDVIKNSMEFNLSKMIIHMDNLGDMLNQFLNENWEPLHNETKRDFGIALGETITESFKKIFEKVSFEELFLT